jgi:general secretion pathway protein K
MSRRLPMAMPGRKSPRHARGIALVLVMLLMVMTVLLSAEIMERLEQDRVRTANLLVLEQSWAYLLSAEAMGIRALGTDLEEDRKEGKEVDACSEEEWALRLGPLPWDNGIFSLSIQDLQGRLNVNNLAATKDGERVLDRLQVERLKRLLQPLLSSEQQDAATALAEEAADWTDGNTLVDGLGGAEDTEYEQWRTGNTVFAEVSELRALRASKPALWRAADDKPLFSRYITALPEGTRVNVNTAPAEVLQALVAGLDSGKVEAILAARKGGAIDSVEEVMTLPELAALGANEKKELQNALAVNSEYFQIMSEVSIDGRTLRLVSDVYRPRSGGQPRVIRRDLGQAFAAPEEACNPGASEEREEQASEASS